MFTKARLRFIILLAALVLFSFYSSPAYTTYRSTEEWLLVENFDVLTFPSGVRNVRSLPIAGPYPYLKHARKMSCHRAKLILSRRITAEEMTRLECVPIMMRRRIQ